MKKKDKVVVKTVILNGTSVWWGVIGFIFIHGAAGVWGAATIVNKVDNIGKKVTELASTAEENRKEAKVDLQQLRTEIYTRGRK